ncbi:MAG TPA: GNAT family N-acetyltransferase [Streptosporangiaceae bacterium]|nr:GNAT family N-acetyltransferase [Streptosporangiaceae bacterium]
MSFVSELLDPERHYLDAFDCGNESLDRWLRNSADRAQRQDTGRTWVWHDGSHRVVAYYTLAAHMLDRAKTTENPGSVPSDVPATLLGKLALSQDLRGQGLGTQLLTDAVTRCARSNDLVASRYVVADAIDDAAERFYLRHRFIKIPDTARLYIRMKDITAAIASRPR